MLRFGPDIELVLILVLILIPRFGPKGFCVVQHVLLWEENQLIPLEMMVPAYFE